MYNFEPLQSYLNVFLRSGFPCFHREAEYALLKTTDGVTKSPVVTKSVGAKPAMSLIIDTTNLKNHEIRSLVISNRQVSLLSSTSQTFAP